MNKYNLLKNIYQKYKCEIPFENVFDPKWLNDNCAFDSAKEELNEKTIKIKNDLAKINDLYLLERERKVAFQVYKETMDLREVLKNTTDYSIARNAIVKIIPNRKFHAMYGEQIVNIEVVVNSEQLILLAALLEDNHIKFRLNEKERKTK